MATQTYSNCAYTRLISFFTNKFGTKAVAKYSIYRDKIAVADKRKKLAKRILLGNIDLNKRQLLLPLPKLPYRPAIRLSSRSPRRSSPFKRRRSQGLILEKQGSLKRKFRKRDKTIIYKDFLSSYGSLFIISLLSAYMLTLILPNRTVLLPFILRPQVLIDTGLRPISLLPEVKGDDDDDNINNYNDDVDNYKDNTPSLNCDSNSDSDFFADIDNIYLSLPL